MSLQHLIAVFGVGQIPRAGAHEIVGRDPQRPAARVRDVGEPALGVVSRDHVAGVLGQAPVAGLALGQVAGALSHRGLQPGVQPHQFFFASGQDPGRGVALGQVMRERQHRHHAPRRVALGRINPRTGKLAAVAPQVAVFRKAVALGAVGQPRAQRTHVVRVVGVHQRQPVQRAVQHVGGAPAKKLFGPARPPTHTKGRVPFDHGDGRVVQMEVQPLEQPIT